ncbi:hypothetical protein CHLRE_02g111526v5 [Chlamydomonas reinhardtii]|uniref:Uncharacterized protein n=1 Tax=Chlamydomonas reinhardtii TaxID=3055 RepID=A0A2K3E306_CHLRE|nr:uncharacterized protein CHLRE_02g111526v5 [Chlamydomonas reinhardtii]PNW87166.1 hypothetical protein CHLRE_02g111526v5 [Chlamydomonas reinhardtii]
MGSASEVGGGDRAYRAVMSAVDITALLAASNEPLSPAFVSEAVLQQALWAVSDRYAVCGRGPRRALIFRSLRGEVWTWERDWVVDSDPPVCPPGLVPKLLEVAVRAEEIFRARCARTF